MPGTISTTIISTYTLTANPTTITDAGAVSVASGAAIYGPGGTAWTVGNAGQISGADGGGIYLKSSGVVTNQSTGLIEANGTSAYGVSVGGNGGATGTVVNLGTIASPLNIGVGLYNGGAVTNATGGTISGGGTAGVGINLYQGGTVINADAALITGYGGVDFANQAGTVGNAGVILATGTGTYGSGVYLAAGGTLANLATGTISGSYGVAFGTIAGTVSNSGTIAGAAASGDVGVELDGGGSVSNSGTVSGAYGVVLRGAGSVINTASAVIAGAVDNGVLVTGGAGTLSNAGSITNTGTNFSAVYFHDGGSVVNAAGGVIASSYHGIYISGGGTVTNAGSILATGASTVAVYLAGGYANRVIVDPGAVFGGVVDGGNTIGSTAASTLELAAGTGTLAGIGGAITNFGGIAFDPGAAWDISGVLAGFGGTVSGFAPGDTIHLTDVVANGGTYAAGQLDLYDSGSPVGQITLAGSFTGDKFTVDPVTGITVACFVAGTRVLTDAGEIAVEDLRPGTRVVSLLHRRLLSVVWIGYRRMREAWPVRVSAGAFGAGVPHRDLWLSHDHAVFVAPTSASTVDDVLVPVRYLINGATIVQEHRDEVLYFHVELAEHGVLLAEGLPAESFLDTGNRSAFANGGSAVQMKLDFALRVWERQACAKLVTDGPAIVGVRERLLARAEQLGWTTTDAPAPLLLASGQRIAPRWCGDDCVTFLLPPDCRHATLSSRAMIPAQIDPHSTDHRSLGLAVTALELDGIALPLGDARLGAGWHAPEPGLRWTDGAARIALAGEHIFAIWFARLPRYRIGPGTALRATTGESNFAPG